MLRHFARLRTFSVAALFAAIFAILTTPVSLAQVKSASRASVNSFAMAAPRTGNAQRVSSSTLKTNESSASLQDTENPLFLPAVFYDSGASGTGSVVIADVNGDGKPDIVVTNTGGGSNSDGSVGVLLGNGDGTFQPVALYDSGGWQPGWLAVADVNGDGFPDLIVANRCVLIPYGAVNGSVGVLLGNGDGTFQPVTTYDSGGGPASGVAVADVNGDGIPDIVTTNCDSIGRSCLTNGVGIVGVLLGNGDGTFQAAATYNLNSTLGVFGADGVTIGDVNEDGIPDLVVGTGWGAGHGWLAILLGKGDGTFTPQNLYPVGTISPASGPVIADVNGDGIPDLLAVSYYSHTVSVLLGQQNAFFRPELSYAVSMLPPASVAVADVNGDGKPDLVVGPAVLFGNGDGTFQTAAVYTSGGFGPAAVADLNNDGRLDLVVANSNMYSGNGSVAVLLNNRQGPPYASTTTTLTSSANPAARKQNITYTATVTSQSGKAVSGTVTFMDKGQAFVILPLSGNQASWTASYTKTGWRYITAAYSGDAANSFSNAAQLRQYVGVVPVATGMTVHTSKSHSAYGQAVTFTATVTWQGGTVPDGESVTFSDGANAIGTATTTAGVARFTTSSLAIGTHVIGASYSGDATFKPIKKTIAQVILGATTTALVSSLNPSTYGQAVTFTATVTSTGPNTPTGMVKFGSLGSAKLIAGVATLTKTWLNAGTYAITAQYMGDSISAPSASPVLTQIVNPASTTTTIASSANPSSSGQSVTFTATVTSSTGAHPTGTVTFAAGATTLGTVALTGITASVSTAALPLGPTTITATYNGATDFIGSSASLTQTVQP